MAMKKEFCPECGEVGMSVKKLTLNSLLKENEKDRIGDNPYFFCKTFSCPVVYFDEASSSVFEKDALTVRVGIKESGLPRPVCYCFDHTIEDIEEEIARTGECSVSDDIATRMKEVCWCETKNPMGSCCISTVNKYIKFAKADSNLSTAKLSSSSARKLKIFTTVGAVFTAVLSSACCWVPLLLIGLGISGSAASASLESYRSLLLVVSAGFLSTGFYLVYKKPVEPADCCSTSNNETKKIL